MAEPETILPSLTIDADAIIELATEQSAALLAAERVYDEGLTAAASAMFGSAEATG